MRAHGYGRRGVILCRKNIAGHPADIGAECNERFDEDGSLYGHVQRAHNPRARQRRLARVFRAQRHQPRHFKLGETNFFAAPFG